MSKALAFTIMSLVSVAGFILFHPSEGWSQSNSIPQSETAAPPITSPNSTLSASGQNGEASATAIEKVEVTGSHIKRVDTEGTSPVTTITRKDIEKTGYNSVADVLRDTTASSFGADRETSGSSTAGVAHVNLRGLGSSNTLVLLNGERLPTDAIDGAVDLNLIPMAAVERIEVLKDGASAIYGSDALGGVVNIITRKNFNGNEASFTESIPQASGGKKQEVSIMSGFTKGRLSMVNVAQYRNNETVFSKDRDWTSQNISTIGNPGSYRNANGKWVADPSCPANRIQHTPQGDFCTFNTGDYSTQLPALQQMSALSESNYKVNSRVKMKARVSVTQKEAQWSFAPAPGNFTIPASTADHLGPGGGPLPGVTPGQDLDVRYRLQGLGTRDTEVSTLGYNALLGSTIQLKDSWELQVNASQNRIENKDKGVNGYALTKTLLADIESGRANIFAPGSNFNNARYVPEEDTISELSNLDIKTTGEIAQLEAGPIGIALGTSLTFQKYDDSFDDQSVAGEVFGNAGSSGGGSRSSTAAYTEISIPVTKKLELQLAERYDHYNDFGDTQNPKVALLYHASSSVLLRASAGTGFKAPLMQDLYAATSNGYPTFIDHVACAKEQAAGGAAPSCTPQQYQVTSSGNKGLQEERSISYNAGVIVSPTADFNIGTDLFLTKLNNVVGIDYEDLTKAEAQGIDVSKSGIKVNRDANGYIQSIDAPLQNLSEQEIFGLDFSSNYRIKNIKLSLEHSQLFYFKEEGFPGTGARNKLGENGRPPWRNTASLSYAPSEKHEVSFAAITTASQEKAVAEDGDLPSYTTVDFQYVFRSKTFGSISAGIKNLLGSTPPLDDSNPSAPLNVSLYDQIGRQYYSGYKTTF